MREGVTPERIAESTCTCGNFGPGFDVFSLALARAGDRVAVRFAGSDTVAVEGVGASRIPHAFDRNAASIAAAHLRALAGIDTPLSVHVTKRVPPGSGLGSSASSSAAGARACAALLEVTRSGARAFTRDELLEAAAAGERAVSGDHRDDVAAALFGGLAVVTPGAGNPISIALPASMRLAFVAPAIELATRDMRAALPREVPLRDTSLQLAAVARMVDAAHRGDVRAMGEALVDRIAAPARAKFIPLHDEARKTAMEEGAYGFAISGSGPAMFALTDSDPVASRIVARFADLFATNGVAADTFVTRAAEVRA
ncbi:MAG: homoserine kinase [Thermoplasmatota archaeon]